jgi:hypothetical protein
MFPARCFSRRSSRLVRQATRASSEERVTGRLTFWLFTSTFTYGKLSSMKHIVLSVTVIVMVLFAAPDFTRADSTPPVSEAAQDLVSALAELGVTVSATLVQELSKAGERLTKEHFDIESWRGPGLDPEEYVGGFNLKLYPKGKSKSDEHLKAETYYRLDRHGLKELEFSTIRK